MTATRRNDMPLAATRSAAAMIFSGTTSRGKSPWPSQTGQTPLATVPAVRHRVQRTSARDTGVMVRSFYGRGEPTRPGRVTARRGPHLRGPLVGCAAPLSPGWERHIQPNRPDTGLVGDVFAPTNRA